MLPIFSQIKIQENIIVNSNFMQEKFITYQFIKQK